MADLIAGMPKEARAKREIRLARKLKFKGKNEKKTRNPPKINEFVVARIEDAISLGCTQTEACLLAGISPKTLLEWQKDNPLWVERKEFLARTQIRKAKNVISDALDNGDVNTAKWYLEKKCRDEFGNQIKIDNTVTIKQAVVNWQKSIDTEFKEINPEETQEIEFEEQKLIEYSEEQEEESGTSPN